MSSSRAIKVDSVTIERFRTFRKLHVQGLGLVNLIVGKNNTGKSSFLEAVRILATDAALGELQTILRDREEYATGPEAERSPRSLRYSGLFHGCREISERPEPFRISAHGSIHPKEVSIRIGWFSRARDDQGNLQYEEHHTDEPEGEASVEITTSDGTRIHQLQNPRIATFLLNRRSNKGVPCFFIGPHSGANTAELGTLWDGIALSDSEEEVVQALRIIDPYISKVTMVGGDGSRMQRTAYVRTEALPRPVPLRLFGDGMNRLFAIILALVNARLGLMLIDEFENGLHYSIQMSTWRTVFRLAKKLDTQVFATTHSWDTISAFQQAAAESRDTGVLLRLARRGDEILPTVFEKEEVAIATRERIEVR